MKAFKLNFSNASTFSSAFLRKLQQRLIEHKWFFLILTASALVFMPFLGEHWVHDSYLVARYGYNYMAPRLFNQGRVLSSIYLRGLNILNMPFVPAMTLSVSLSIIILSLASYNVFKAAKESGVYGKLTGALALIGSAGIFFNLFVADTLMFIENATMSLGVLFAVLAARYAIRTKYVRSAILALLCVFSYQAVIAYYLPIVLLFPEKQELLPKHGLGTDENEINVFKLSSLICLVKRFFASFLQYARCKILPVAIYALVLASNYAFTRFVSSDARVAGSVSIRENVRSCYLAAVDFARDTMQMTPKYLYFAFLCAFSVLIILAALKIRSIWPIIRSVFGGGALIICALLPHVMMSYFYVMPRSAVALPGIGGLLIVAVSLSEVNKKSKRLDAMRKKPHNPIRWKALSIVSIVIAVAYTITISTVQLDMQLSSIRNNRLDAAETEEAAEIIREYEANSGLKITHIYVLRDSSTVFTRPGVRNYRDLTVRAMSVSWMVPPLLSNLLGRELQDLPTPDGARERLFGDREWDEFSAEQLVFDEEHLYFCIY